MATMIQTLRACESAAKSSPHRTHAMYRIGSQWMHTCSTSIEDVQKHYKHTVADFKIVHHGAGEQPRYPVPLSAKEFNLVKAAVMYALGSFMFNDATKDELAALVRHLDAHRHLCASASACASVH